MQELAKRIPIGTFVDHGPTVEAARADGQDSRPAYAELYGKAKHLVVKPGDRVPITGLDWRIVTSAGQVLKTPLPGAGRPTLRARGSRKRPITDDPENGQSLGSVVTFGQFRRSISAICSGTRSTNWCARPIPSAPSTCTW